MSTAAVPRPTDDKGKPLPAGKRWPITSTEMQVYIDTGELPSADAPAVAHAFHPHLKLYEATDALEIVREWLCESEGELTPEIEALLNDAALDFDLKAERVALMVREFITEGEAIAAEAERLAARAKAREKGAERLKAYLHREMTAAERPVVKRPLVTIRVQASAPSVRGELPEEKLRNLAQIAPSLVRHVPEKFNLDARALLAAEKNGEQPLEQHGELLAGIEIVRGSHVRIY